MEDEANTPVLQQNGKVSTLMVVLKFFTDLSTDQP